MVTVMVVTMGMATCGGPRPYSTCRVGRTCDLLCMLYISVAVIMIVVTVVTVIGVVGTKGAATGGDHHPHTTVGVDDILGLGQDLTPRVSIVRALVLEYRSVWQFGCSLELHRITTCFCYIKRKKVLNSIKQYPLYLYSTHLLPKSKI